jgi:cytosine/uracil/thiamine/allantoin permease
MFNSLLVQKVYAISSDPINPLKGITNLQSLFTWATNLIIVVGLGMCIIMLAVGFIRFITSQGDKVQTETAQKWVTYAVFGGVGLFAVYAIKAVLLNIVGQTTDPLQN